jgi:hypothetical protein
MTSQDLITDPARCEQQAVEGTAWGDNFLEIRGQRHSKRDTIHTRCNTCEAHTD